jgi:hypothetical protein
MADEKPGTKPVEPPKPNQDLPKPDVDRPHPEPHRPGDRPKPDQDLPRERERKEDLEKIQKILAEFGGAESNIPITHEYWVLLNRYRAKDH